MWRECFKSYSVAMFRALKTFFLLTLIFQGAMLPAQATSANIEFQYSTKFNVPENFSDLAQHSFQPQYLQNQRGEKDTLKKNCSSYQCASIVAAPTSVRPSPILIMVKYRSSRWSHPLLSVVVSPPLRPPTS
jgi:hypothetical protein